MPAKDPFMQVWFEAFSETNALENELVKLKGLIVPLEKQELLHLLSIATGNLRSIREYLITNQAAMIRHMKVVAKERKGG